MVIVVQIRACPNISSLTFTSSPFARSKEEKVCRKVCQPMSPNPASLPAGLRRSCCTRQGQYGASPSLNGLANTQSSSELNWVPCLQFNKTSASAVSERTTYFGILGLYVIDYARHYSAAD